jgi:hypothetical protein
MAIYCVPGTVVLFSVLTHFLLTTLHGDMYCHFPNLIDEETQGVEPS